MNARNRNSSGRVCSDSEVSRQLLNLLTAVDELLSGWESQSMRSANLHNCAKLFACRRCQWFTSATWQVLDYYSLLLLYTQLTIALGWWSTENRTALQDIWLELFIYRKVTLQSSLHEPGATFQRSLWNYSAIDSNEFQCRLIGGEPPTVAYWKPRRKRKFSD